MPRLWRHVAVGLVVLLSAVGAVGVLSNLNEETRSDRLGRYRSSKSAVRPSRSKPSGGIAPVPLFSSGFVDDSGYTLATLYNGPIRDRADIDQVRAASEGRRERGLADLSRKLERLGDVSTDEPLREAQRAQIQMMMGLLHMYDGGFEEAIRLLDRAATENGKIPAALKANLGALAGVASLRRGEIANCVACLGPSSCILPIAPEARHQFPEGSREAIRRFRTYLKERPEDYGVRWLLNVACMTIGDYPDRVPDGLVIPLDRLKSTKDIGRFANLAPFVGIDARGANMFGGNIVDDFDGDGLLDLFVTSYDWDRGSSLFVNRGDGSFDDRSESAGLAAHGMAQNLSHADFDNDGRLDVLLLRGGWESAYRMTLLRQAATGTFEDVTLAAGLGEPIATQAAVWADYDNDGDLDLFVGGEYHGTEIDPRNRSRLYQNRGDGTFVDVAERAGVQNDQWAKGASWGDYDADGHIDLYVSNMNARNRLYRNNGDGTFTDVAAELHVDGPEDSFACWFWDYDNDGRLDLYVASFHATMQDIGADILGKPNGGTFQRLYRNLGKEGFRDVASEAGIDLITLPMGCNYGDLDNDGFLDFYLGTGRPPYSHLIPNLMFLNEGGRTFSNVTLSSGTGHLQKGHGVAFADWDNNGDLDLFVQTGGTTPGDRGHNLLFENPGHGRHWLRVKLAGTKSNRSGVGAKVEATIIDRDGKARTLHRHVTAGSSFGGNPLEVHLGLGPETKVAELTVLWPATGVRQTIRDLPADRSITITEGLSGFKDVTLPKLEPRRKL